MPTNKRLTKKKRTTRFRGGDDDVNKCMDTKCSEKEKEKSYESTKKIFEDLLKESESMKEKKKNEIKNLKPEEKKKMEKYIKNISKILKKMNNATHKKKEITKLRDLCKQKFCNKGCLGTIFEEGEPDKLPDDFIKKFKKSKELIHLFKENRKKMFGTKKNVLVDNFYEGLKTTQKNKYKKEGAISGCVNVL